MKEIELKVEGMHCGGCENRITNALKELKFVKDVNANHETGKVNVTLKKEINEKEKEEIIEVIKRLDFDVIL